MLTAAIRAWSSHVTDSGILWEQVILDFIPWWEAYSYCAAGQIKGCNLTQAQNDLEAMANVGARSRSLLGYYICDDCCSLSDSDTTAQAQLSASTLEGSSMAIN